MRQKFALLLVFLLFATVPVFAQAGGVAGISGVVRDPSGAVVPGAKVVISSQGQGTLRTLESNEAGLFTAPALVPGPGYQVTVTAAGFAGYEAKGLELQVGQNLSLNVNLAVASSATAVEVSAVAALVEDTKTEVSQVVGSQQITELPINGRRVDSFALLTPGVSNDGTYGLSLSAAPRDRTLSWWTAPTPPSSSTTKTPAARASPRRSRRMRCRSSR